MKENTCKTITLFLSLLIFLSCGSQTQEKKVDFDLQEMSSVPLDGELMQECLLTPYCNQMKFIQSALFHFAPIQEEACLVTTVRGDTLGFLSSVGNGPGELNRWPYFSGTSVHGDTVYMYDNMSHKLNAYAVQIKDQNLTYSFLGNKPTRENGDGLPEGVINQMAFELVRLENGYSIGFRVFSNGTIFTLFDKDLNEVKKFGEYLVDEGLIDGEFHQSICFQGLRLSRGNSFFYAPHNFGYMARYDVSDEGELSKVWERWYSEPSVSVDNNNLKFEADNPQGFYGLAVGEKYIFAAYSGVPAGDMYKEKSAYALNPKFLYVLDLEGKPLAKFSVDKRISAMCLDEKEEYLYVKHIDPDLSLWRYDVSEMLQHIKE
jgi:hypothetical protein